MVKPNLEILVIDDDGDMVHLMERIIPRLIESKISIAQDGIQALKSCHHKKFDLIISDCLMPHLNGHGLVHELRRPGTLNSDTPIILMSQAYQQINKEKYFDKDIELIPKPIDIKDLRDKIFEAL